VLLRRLAAGALLTSLLLAATATAGRAGVTLSYDATVDAAASRAYVTIPGGPVADQIVDLGFARAQAHLNSLGTSTARAALPYPGDIPLGLPGLASTFGVPAHIPSYPLFAESSNPSTRSASAAAAPVVLTATSDDTSSVARADIDSGQAAAPSSRTEASVKATADHVVALATTTVRGLAIGPVSLDALTATASVTRSPSGLSRTSTLRAVGLSIAGTPLTLDQRGITLAGTTLPLSASGALRTVLKAAGVDLTFLAGHRTANGVVSPSLLITSTRDVPQLPLPIAIPKNPLPGLSTATVTAVFGQVGAEVAGSAYTDPVLVPFVPPSTVVPPSSPVPPPAPAGSGQAPVVGGDPGGLAGPAPAAPPVVAGEQPAPQQLATRALATPVAWSSSFYLALAGAGLLVVLVLTLVRYLGVRQP
jgi:hypothetical protein